ncbi:hypothetical protein B0T21DRAFT_353382 [Apiosordaria backusii]|uniref:Uncharacterized protein n=1 Tax=Apiosordaria backusii TaxID=314023 RepID=A0AA40DJD8_9PEZI|nr:hypothetical protein B0T21DRAFT_353382 [Apiosordaria backusii]
MLGGYCGGSGRSPIDTFLRHHQEVGQAYIALSRANLARISHLAQDDEENSTGEDKNGNDHAEGNGVCGSMAWTSRAAITDIQGSIATGRWHGSVWRHGETMGIVMEGMEVAVANDLHVVHPPLSSLNAWLCILLKKLFYRSVELKQILSNGLTIWPACETPTSRITVAPILPTSVNSIWLETLNPAVHDFLATKVHDLKCLKDRQKKIKNYGQDDPAGQSTESSYRGVQCRLETMHQGILELPGASHVLGEGIASLLFRGTDLLAKADAPTLKLKGSTAIMAEVQSSQSQAFGSMSGPGGDPPRRPPTDSNASQGGIDWTGCSAPRNGPVYNENDDAASRADTVEHFENHDTLLATSPVADGLPGKVDVAVLWCGSLKELRLSKAWLAASFHADRVQHIAISTRRGKLHHTPRTRAGMDNSSSGVDLRRGPAGAVPRPRQAVRQADPREPPEGLSSSSSRKRQKLVLGSRARTTQMAPPVEANQMGYQVASPVENDAAPMGQQGQGYTSQHGNREEGIQGGPGDADQMGFQAANPVNEYAAPMGQQDRSYTPQHDNHRQGLQGGNNRQEEYPYCPFYDLLDDGEEEKELNSDGSQNHEGYPEWEDQRR